MSSTTFESPAAGTPRDHAKDAHRLTFALSEQLEDVMDLSELFQFVAKSAATDTVLLSDAESSERVWRAVALIHQNVYRQLLDVQTDAQHRDDFVLEAVTNAGDQ